MNIQSLNLIVYFASFKKWIVYFKNHITDKQLKNELTGVFLSVYTDAMNGVKLPKIIIVDSWNICLVQKSYKWHYLED